MKINEAELAIGITKKNIRFYEQEGLLSPSRTPNGYRDYSNADVDVLRRIKLLRKLDIPLEEIRQLQSGILTLEDCLQRHLIVLARRRRNLEAIEDFCGRMLSKKNDLSTFPVERLLAEMDDMEKGGTKFLDIRKKDKKTKKLHAALAAGCVIMLMAWMLAITIWSFSVETGTPILVITLSIFLPLAVIAGTLIALIQRFKEIEGGEIDEASKY